MIKNSKTISFALMLLIFSPIIKAQGVFSFNPGAFINSGGFDRDVFGGGAVLGLEYTPKKHHLFSIELRSRLGGYKFDAENKRSFDDDDDILFPIPTENDEVYSIDYSLFNAQLALVPKLNYYLDDEFWFFLENEFSAGLFTGSFKYMYEKEHPRNKRIANHILNYTISIGAGCDMQTWAIYGSIGYSTLNFRGDIRRHSPMGFSEGIPDQNAAILFNIQARIPLTKGKKK